MSVDRILPKTSESLQGKSDLYWYKYFEEDDALFLKINNFYSNTQPDITEEEKKTWPNIFDFEKELVKAVKTTNPDKIVIDLRNNNGGYLEYTKVFLSIFKEHIDLDNIELVAFTGKRTLSAGVIFAWQLQNDLGATIIGEKTGGNINSFGTVI